MTRSLPSTRATHAADAKGFRLFTIIWASQLLARVGNGLTPFALTVYAYQTSGMSSAVAAVTIAGFLPSVVLAPLAGIFADRFDRRLLILLGSALSSLGVLALAFFFEIDGVGLVTICVCLGVSSIFAALIDPAYRATVTDLLTPDQYARAGGLVQLASASQYLVSPLIAGFLVTRVGVKVTLLVDVALTAVSTVVMVFVWRATKTVVASRSERAWQEFTAGVAFLVRNRGVTALVLLATLVTFCIGFLQVLLTPVLLDIADEEVLGIVLSTAAIGMVVSSIVIGVFGLGKRYQQYIARFLAIGGVAIASLGASTTLWMIGVCAFLFFLTLPVLNTSIEVLARTAIPNAMQGRVWGLIGLLSQLGYVAAYAVSGVLADAVFSPLLSDGGPWVGSVGRFFGTGESRGIGLLLVLVGIVLCVIALAVPRIASIRNIQHRASSGVSDPEPEMR